MGQARRTSASASPLAPPLKGTSALGHIEPPGRFAPMPAVPGACRASRKRTPVIHPLLAGRVEKQPTFPGSKPTFVPPRVWTACVRLGHAGVIDLRSKIQRLSPSGFGAVNTRLRATSRRAAPWALDGGLLRRCRPGTGRCEEVFVGVQLVGPPPEVLETLRLPFAFKQQTGLLAGQQAHACTLGSSQSSLGGP